MKYIIEIFFILTLNFCYYNCKKLPLFVQKCNSSRPDFNSCIIQNMEMAKPYLLKGIPEFYLPSIEPLFFPKIEIEIGNGTLNAVFTDLNVYGVADMLIRDFIWNLTNQEFYFNFYFPDLHAKGHYSVAGKLLFFDLNASGIGYVNLTSLDVKAWRKYKLEVKNGKHYAIFVDQADYDIKYDKASIKFESLVNNNQQLTDQLNQAMNDNFQEIAKEFNPVMYKTFLSYFSSKMQTILNEYPMEDLYV